MFFIYFSKRKGGVFRGCALASASFANAREPWFPN